MEKILMVCLGNICRSPMAEGIVQDAFRRHNIAVEVHSAGTAGYHIGESADLRAQAELRKHQIDISNERAQQFIPEFFQTYDFIFTMDRNNFSDVYYLAETEEERAKVDMLMNVVYAGENIPIPDPYYGGSSGFSQVYSMISEAAEALVQNYKSKKK